MTSREPVPGGYGRTFLTDYADAAARMLASDRPHRLAPVHIEAFTLLAKMSLAGYKTGDKDRVREYVSPEVPFRTTGKADAFISARLAVHACVVENRDWTTCRYTYAQLCARGDSETTATSLFVVGPSGGDVLTVAGQRAADRGDFNHLLGYARSMDDYAQAAGLCPHLTPDQRDSRAYILQALTLPIPDAVIVINGLAAGDEA